MSECEDPVTFSSPDAHMRLPEYMNDAVDQEFLKGINEALLEFESNFDFDLSDQIHVPINIIGVPRSGTTLISQLLVSRCDLGFVSNLMARFHRVPRVGAFLQNQLFADGTRPVPPFGSTHGVTSGIAGPHEFGYFWSRHLGIDGSPHQLPPGEYLEQSRYLALWNELAAIESILGKPLVSKNILGCFHLPKLIEHTPIFFVHVVRDRESTIRSILKVRTHRLGSEEHWWSLRPYGFEQVQNLSAKEQVAWQYDQIHDAIQRDLMNAADRSVTCSLEQLVSEPEKTIHTIVDAYQRSTGYSVESIGSPLTQRDLMH